MESFGRVVAGTSRVVDPATAAAMLAERDFLPGQLLAYGNGRSYGDTCQNASGTLVDMRGARRILSFDPATGLLEAEAGVLLSDIIEHAAPHGFFPPVVPGTRFVTLGGAIANDVHGKNHHRRGTFGRHVEVLTLLRSSGVRSYAATRKARLFSATVGGMGLTGLILKATIRLMRVGSPDVIETVRPFRSLDEYFDLAEAADLENEYAVAWIDQLAGGKNFGRGLLIAGNHADEEAGRRKPARALSVPFQPPLTLLNRPFLKAFNMAYRTAKTRHAGIARRAAWESFFFPLDGVRDWNRLYGPRGLHQHQSVVPFEAAHAAIPALLEAARRAGQGSFLTVLKRFGEVKSPGLFSFPRPGYTLTLDFPNHGRRTLALLGELDRIATDAGGAVNPYKDARMSAGTFAASFPNWHRLEAARDPAFSSDFWARTALCLRDRESVPAQAAE